MKNTLKKARGQLPKDKPSMVFVKVPASWIADREITRAMFETGRSFLETVQRIVSVVLYAAPLDLANNVMRHSHVFKEIVNQNTAFGDNLDWRIFRQVRLTPEMNGMPLHWQRILFFPDGRPKRFEQQ
jgi:hypothetical protein